MNKISSDISPINILLVEDSKGDILLTKRAFKTARIANNIEVVRDGSQAMDFLNAQGEFKAAKRPDLILMDLNIPGRSGIEILEQIKSDKNLRSIPVIILSSSEADSDIEASYKNYASGYIVKPINVQKFIQVAESIEDFWFSVVKLPYRKNAK